MTDKQKKSTTILSSLSDEYINKSRGRVRMSSGLIPIPEYSHTDTTTHRKILEQFQNDNPYLECKLTHPQTQDLLMIVDWYTDGTYKFVRWA